MKKLFFLLIPFFLFADYLYIQKGHSYLLSNPVPIKKIGVTNTCAYPVLSLSSSYVICGYRHINLPSSSLAYHNGSSVYIGRVTIKPVSVNMDCVKKNMKRLSWYYLYDSSLYSGDVSFCINKEGYIYSSVFNVWMPTKSNSSNQPICPYGLEWSSTQKKCISLDDCPYGQTLYNGKCYTIDNLLKNLLSPSDYNYVKKNCSIVNHSLIDSRGDQLCSASLICNHQDLKDIQVSCGRSDTSNSHNTVYCSADQNIVIDSNGNVSCVDSNNSLPIKNSSGSNTKSHSNGSDNSVASSNFSNSNKNSNSNDSDNSVGSSDSSNSNSTSDSNTSGISNNGSFNDVLSKLNATNSKLGQINNNLNTIINLKPKKKFFWRC